MWESIMNFLKKIAKRENQALNSKDAAKERLHLVLMQDRANVSADFLELMKQEIIEVIKKYIDVDENAIDVRLTNKDNGDGTKGAPALYANIPIINLKDEIRENIQNPTPEVSEDKPKKVQEDKLEKNETGKEDEDKVEVEDQSLSAESEEIIHDEQKEQEEKEVIKNTEN